MEPLILILLLMFSASSIQTPDHCYEFTSASVGDGCGSSDLTRIGKRFGIMQDGINGSPSCNEGGCSFLLGALFHTPVPSGMGDTWTIGLWMRERKGSTGNAFDIYPVS